MFLGVFPRVVVAGRAVVVAADKTVFFVPIPLGPVPFLFGVTMGRFVGEMALQNVEVKRSGGQVTIGYGICQNYIPRGGSLS